MHNNHVKDSTNGKHIELIAPLPYIGELTNDFRHKVNHNTVYTKLWGVGSFVPMLHYVRLSKFNQIPKTLGALY